MDILHDKKQLNNRYSISKEDMGNFRGKCDFAKEMKNYCTTQDRLASIESCRTIMELCV